MIPLLCKHGIMKNGFGEKWVVIINLKWLAPSVKVIE